MSTNSGNRPSVYLVVQRYRSARLLLDESRWVSVPATAAAAADDDDDTTGDQQRQRQRRHCGLLLYVSFAAGAGRGSARAAAEACLNLPVLTAGLWGDGVSEPRSVRDLLLAKKEERDRPETAAVTTTTSVTIVPQANLISKVPLNCCLQCFCCL